MSNASPNPDAGQEEDPDLALAKLLQAQERELFMLGGVGSYGDWGHSENTAPEGEPLRGRDLAAPRGTRSDADEVGSVEPPRDEPVYPRLRAQPTPQTACRTRSSQDGSSSRSGTSRCAGC